MSSVPAAVYNVAELQKEFVELSEEFKDLEVRHLFFFLVHLRINIDNDLTVFYFLP